MRSLIFGVILGLFTLAPFGVGGHESTEPRFEWKQCEDNPVWWGLYVDGCGIGAWSSDSGEYRPLLSRDNYGPSCRCPAKLPFSMEIEFGAGNNFGISRRIIPGIRYGGEGKRTLDELFTAGKDADVPAFQTMPSFTVVAADLATAERVVADLNSSPSLAPYRAAFAPRAKAYTPDNFALKVFRLEIDRRFQQSKLVIIIQSAPDADDRAPVRKIYGYDGPELLASRLRDIDLNYDPNKEPATLDAGPWTRLNIALAVGLAVTAIYSLLLGGILRWKHS